MSDMTTASPGENGKDYSGAVHDEALLKRERVKFGFGTVLFQSEEIGLGGVPTAIVRLLGGNDLHVGIIGGMAGVTSITQFFGALVLRWKKSNRAAMIFAVMTGFALAALISVTILFSQSPSMAGFDISLFGRSFTVAHPALYLYLVLSFFFFAVSGMMWNIESTWIGDLVPKNRLGSFTSVKWMIGVAGIVIFTWLISWISDTWKNAAGFSIIYAMFAVSFVIAAKLYSTITDCTPANLNFISDGSSHHERLNYRSLPLWCYISFYVLWAGGRSLLIVFMFAFLMDVYQFSMKQLALLLMIQPAISIGVIFFLGKFTDRKGHRVPLIIVSAFVATSMLLWVITPWCGAWYLVPIIIYQIIAGAAGNTHSMLAINTALEIFPHKGRSDYLGFSRIVIGTISLGLPILAGKIMQGFNGIEFQFLDATITRYHVVFLIGSLLAMSCIIPLLIMGNRKVENQ